MIWPRLHDAHRAHQLGEDVAAAEGRLLQPPQRGRRLGRVALLEFGQAPQLGLLLLLGGPRELDVSVRRCSAACGSRKVLTPTIGSPPLCFSSS